MDDHERIIRIDERLQHVIDRVDEVLTQCKLTNGRVNSLERYQEKDEVRAQTKILEINDHEGRLVKLEEAKSESKGSARMFFWVCSAASGVVAALALAFEYWTRHGHQ